MMTSIKNLQKQIDEIKARNKRVEADKAWETSNTRKIILFILTYIVISVFFILMKLPEPLSNALIAAVAFALSTLTLEIFKKRWIRKFHKK